MKIAIGSDHAGFEYKRELINWLKIEGYELIDCGTDNKESTDYPDFALKVTEEVKSKSADYGILICGTGIGMAITANKITGIRAANCCNEHMAFYSRAHNNANILTLGSRIISLEAAKLISKVFLEEEFEGGRHLKRVDKIHNLTGK